MDDDQLHVVLVGTGCPMFDPTRSGPCTAVLAGEHFFLVDTGPGAWHATLAAKLPQGRLSGILFTHYHSDHIGDLGETMTGAWIANADRRDAPLPIYGGPGIHELASGINQAYEADIRYRNVHHGDEYMPASTAGVTGVQVDVPEAEGVALWDQEAQVPLLPAPRFNWRSSDGPSAEVVRVTAFHVEHDPCKPAYGYKFEYRGRTAVVSGDTAYCPSVVRQARGADLLVHEACACGLVERMKSLVGAAGERRMQQLLTDLSQPNVHTTPALVMRVAREAGVRHLAYTHIVPPMRNLLVRRMWEAEIDTAGFKGGYTVGEDGMHFALPAAASQPAGGGGSAPAGMVMIDKGSGKPERMSASAVRRLGTAAVLAILYALRPATPAAYGMSKYLAAVVCSLYAGWRSAM